MNEWMNDHRRQPVDYFEFHLVNSKVTFWTVFTVSVCGITDVRKRRMQKYAHVTYIKETRLPRDAYTLYWVQTNVTSDIHILINHDKVLLQAYVCMVQIY